MRFGVKWGMKWGTIWGKKIEVCLSDLYLYSHELCFSCSSNNLLTFTVGKIKGVTFALAV